MSQKGSDVARQRAAIFREGAKRYKQAMRDGYYIEAICLVESWIADRLECHLAYVTKDDTAFKTLDNLVRTYGKSDIDAELKRLVAEEVAQWKTHRNTATHEMMKIEQGKHRSWNQRVQQNKAPAVEGLRLFRKIDRRIRDLKDLTKV